MTAEGKRQCDLCVATLLAEGRYDEMNKHGLVPTVDSDDAWLTKNPLGHVYRCCDLHWQLIKRRGVTFDATGFPRINEGPPLDAEAPERFLPLIEQMYAREWLLERALAAHRNYVRILESEPGETTEEEVEAAARILNLADTELREGPVRV